MVDILNAIPAGTFRQLINLHFRGAAAGTVGESAIFFPAFNGKPASSRSFAVAAPLPPGSGAPRDIH